MKNPLEQSGTHPAPAPPPITIRIEKGEADQRTLTFTRPFRVGRDNTCDVRLSDPGVSRFHAEFWYTEGSWWLLDLESANGTYVSGVKVDRTPLTRPARVELGSGGPLLAVEVAAAEPADPTLVGKLSMTQVHKHYIEGSSDREAGQHTLMIRQVVKQSQKRQRRTFVAVAGVLACLALAAGIYAYLKQREVKQQIALAQEIFYAMKSLELQFAPLLKSARSTQDDKLIEQVRHYRVQRLEMERKYNEFLTAIESYDKKLSPEERAVLRITRLFGECDINAPPGFVREVLAYIEKWKSSKRLKEAIDRARSLNYIPTIYQVFSEYDLPPHFFYLALQESDFNVNACGPQTDSGIAKGAWQFIPSTAANYGLRVGPLQHLRQPDPRDERHHFEKSTRAAARYIKDIYDTDAQASGLLVMASYNWGENRVLRLLQRMPENPRERNLWRLLALYRNQIPNETYDYVFSIISAAVIGENPALFGFDFENPLASAEKSS
jgi:soluble lytic murein transglycosylase-like protein